MLTSVTRTPGGDNDCPPSRAWADYKQQDFTRYNFYWEDFNVYRPATDFTTTGTVAQVNGTDGGVISLASTTTVEANVQLGGTAPTRSILPDLTKDLWVAAMINLPVAAPNDPLNSAFFMGLAPSNATPIATPPTDGFYISKAAGSAVPQAVLRVASATLFSVPLPLSFVAGTWFEFVIAYTAQDGALRAFVNDAGVRVASSPASFPGIPLSFNLSIGPGTTAAIQTLQFDYFMQAKARRV